MNRYFWPLIAVLMTSLPSAPLFAQGMPISCKPYVHGELREKLPTFFCPQKADALSYIELMERRRTEELTREEAQKVLAEFQRTRECFYVETSHVSRRTIHQGVGDSKLCEAQGLGATEWPSLIEAELSGDGTTIWVLTNALVPALEK